VYVIHTSVSMRRVVLEHCLGEALSLSPFKVLYISCSGALLLPILRISESQGFTVLLF
jgi:hypothetical protein